MYKNLGGYNWSGLFFEPLSQSSSDQHLTKNVTETLLKTDIKDQSTNMESSIMDDIDILESAQNLQASFINLKNVCYYIFFILKYFNQFSGIILYFLL